jgi:hypothetical protein
MKKPLFSALILVLFITSIIVYNISRGDPFAQPVFVTSNVENGHGIFAGYSNTWKCIPLN